VNINNEKKNPKPQNTIIVCGVLWKNSESSLKGMFLVEKNVDVGP
jgi:hypothetical protein